MQGKSIRSPLRLWPALLALLLIAALALSACGSGGAESGGTEAGGTEATAENAAGEESGGQQEPSAKLEPFDPNAPAGPETGLDKRVAWANTSAAEFFLVLGEAIKDGAKSEGCDYTTAVADDDAQKNVEQMNQFIARGIGAMVVEPLEPESQTPVMERALGEGIDVLGLTNAPTSEIAVTSQYAVGFSQGKAAAEYINEELGGEAEVQVFKQDSLGQPLIERHEGVLAGLETGGPGVKVVSDVPSKTMSIEGGFQTMNTVIQAHPNIKVVLGPDTLVIGAMRALEQTGKLSEDMYLAGIDGEKQALELVKEGGPYRASWAFAWPVLGYTMGTYGCQWIAGKSVPLALNVPAVQLNSPEKVEQYEADMADPARIFADEEALEGYIKREGNISYEERDNYWKEPYIP